MGRGDRREWERGTSVEGKSEDEREGEPGGGNIVEEWIRSWRNTEGEVGVRGIGLKGNG